MILFATKYKNDSSAFHERSAVSGCLALLRAFCQWKIEHQLRKRCVKGLILRAWLEAREMQAVCMKVVKAITQPAKTFGVQIL